MQDFVGQQFVLGSSGKARPSYFWCGSLTNPCLGLGMLEADWLEKAQWDGSFQIYGVSHPPSGKFRL
jgi:hypothetical protein